MYLLTYLLLNLLSSTSHIEMSCDMVLNTTDSGLGSLREVISCSAVGDTVLFDQVLIGDTLSIDSVIVISNDITILDPTGSIYLRTDADAPFFRINEGVHVIIDGLTIIGGKFVEGSTIYNSGILTLNNVTLIDRGYSGVEAIICIDSTGQLLVDNDVTILSEKSTGLIFETNFNLNGHYSVSNLGLWNGGSNNVTQPLEGWDGVFATGGSAIEIVTNEGIAG
ncbi:MAG: hypothetical protein V3V00_09350, partial [Saprospiraceae bacterium]